MDSKSKTESNPCSVGNYRGPQLQPQRVLTLEGYDIGSILVFNVAVGLSVGGQPVRVSRSDRETHRDHLVSIQHGPLFKYLLNVSTVLGV